MKRKNLVLDEQLLEDATRMLGVKTHSEAVNRALAETIRVLKVRELKDLFGTGLWEGDLPEMRRDVRSKRKR